jgi:hypothetical protein
MVHATGKRTRAAVRSHAESPERTANFEAGVVAVPPAFRRAKVTHNSADWLAGLETGLRGAPYIYPADVQDHLAWSSGFIEGAGQRLQRLARIRTPAHALPLWELPR